MTAPPKDEQQTVPNRTDRARTGIEPRARVSAQARKRRNYRQRGSLATLVLRDLDACGGFMDFDEFRALLRKHAEGLTESARSMAKLRLVESGDITITVEITRQGAKRIGGDL